MSTVQISGGGGAPQRFLWNLHPSNLTKDEELAATPSRGDRFHGFNLRLEATVKVHFGNEVGGRG